MPESIDFDNLPASDLHTLIETRRGFELMLASDSWTMYCRFMESQQAVILNSVMMQSLSSTDEIYRQEHDKGRFAGLDIAMNHIKVLIANLGEEIKTRPEDKPDATPPEMDTTIDSTTNDWIEP